MKKIMKKGRDQEGIALVITLLIMTILLIMASAFMSISSTETLIAINERNRIQAYHLAEAAAERAIAELNVNAAYGGTIPAGADVNLGPGSYRVDVCPPRCSPPAITAPADPNQRIVSAMGCVRNCTPPSATSRVEVRVQPGSPFQFALVGLDAAGRAMQLEDNVVVDSYDSTLGPYGGSNQGAGASIHSNNNIEFGSNNTVNGNAAAVGSIQEAAPGTNTVTGGWPPPTGVASQSVSMGITCPPPSGDINVASSATWTLSPGTYSYNQITMGANSSLAIVPAGQVTICMAGRLHVGTGAVINTTGMPTNLVIYSSHTATDDTTGQEAMYFDTGPGYFYGGIYAQNGEVEFQDGSSSVNGWKIYGAIAARQIDIEDYAQFHYDLALARASFPGNKFRPAPGAWQERFPSN